MMTTTVNFSRQLKLTIGALLAGILLMCAALQVPSVALGAPGFQLTPTGVMAEAIGEANLRSGPGVEYSRIGTIYHGQRYAVVARHEFVPWLLIEYPPAPGGQAWVFNDLVLTSGSLEAVPLIDGLTPIPVQSPTISVTTTANPPALAGNQPAVTIEALDEINVRFGPGIEYPRIARIGPGQTYTALSRHALYPWLMIALPEAPEGTGWVFMEVIRVTGDVNSLPVITAEEVGWPTLTPTPQFVVTSAPPWGPASASTPAPQTADSTSPSHPNMQSLGDQILAYLLAQGFAPEEDRFGSVFVLDLASGDNFSFGRDIAYSGMSLIKIPILVSFYRYLSRPADAHQAEIIANTMTCSGNHTANEMLGIMGNGDEFLGTQYVTNTLHQLGLVNSFVVAPFALSEEPVTPDHPVIPLDTDADQVVAFPDPYNQITPEDLGWLLDAVYQCAMTETGPLLQAFPEAFTPTECRQIILAMSANRINVLSEAGVPLGTQVAHKHGWIADTHGDAAIIFTPGGDYVLTMALYQPEWLPYELSWPIIAEVSRMVYNAYNPTVPLDAIHPTQVDETCDLTGNPLLSILSSSIVPSARQALP